MRGGIEEWAETIDPSMPRYWFYTGYKTRNLDINIG
jgi:hypothetical protein